MRGDLRHTWRALRPRHWRAEQWWGYQRGWLRPDVLAGITVTAYLVPQVMAYAELAGLPPVAGLWAAIGALGCYAVVGSSRQLSVGPESTTALMTAAALGAAVAAGHDPVAFAAALALAVAVLCVIGALVGMGAFSDLLSRPVLVGYMAGVAVLMVVSQLHKLTRIPTEGGSVVDELTALARAVDALHWPTALLGLGTLALLLVGSARFPRAPVVLVAMLGAAAVSAVLDLQDVGVRVVGEIPGSIPRPDLPDVSVAEVGSLLVPAVGIALIGFTDNVLTARAFAARHGDRIDARRELVGLGVANLGAGLLQGFPVSSSQSRTAIADAVGARSQLASVVTLATTVVALLAFRPVLAAFPLAALGAVVVYAATKLVDVGELRRLWRFRRSELVLAVATTVAVLAVGVLYGVLLAIGLSVLDLMRRVARPHDAVLGAVPGLAGLHDVDDYPEADVLPGLVVYRYDSPLFFANADDFRRRALAAVDDAESPVRWFVLNTEAMVRTDITAVDALESLRQELTDRGIVVGLARLKQDVRAELAPSGLLERIGEDRIFPTLPTALGAFRADTGSEGRSSQPPP